MKPNNELHYELSEGIATITINRPQARNALNEMVREGIHSAMQEFNNDDNAKVFLLTAAGDLAFSAGADLKEMSERSLKIPGDDFISDLKSDKPVIALVNGLAVGGGFYLVQQADLVIASDNARFGITEARYGRGAPWAASLPFLIPPRIAMEMLITAKTISAERALQIGLVNYVVPLNSLVSTGRELATRIATNAPLSVKAGKQMVREIVLAAMSETSSLINEIWNPVYLSQDAQEGPLAFKEKRAPKWLGK
jgi:enoyl-CoA hydratase/carnithine racemase